MARGVELETVLDQDLFQVQASDSSEALEKILSATKALIEEVKYGMLVSKKYHVALI